MQTSLVALILGFIVDLILGDPVGILHPVQLMGGLISLLEKGIRAICPKTKWGERIGGMILVVLVLTITASATLAILFLAHRIAPGVFFVVEVILCYQMLATKSLKKESMKVQDALMGNESYVNEQSLVQRLVAGRQAVSRIVGRDTKDLDLAGVVKATVETIAENTSDGVIAPMFYMAFGGPILGVLYKAINTMDSMVGYRNESYQYFGTCAAKLDDAVNFIPARLAAYFMMIGTVGKKYSSDGAIMIYARDRKKTASPNAGQTEAVMAGALQIQLGGDAFYFEKLYHKASIGDPVREIQIDDIRKANGLLYRTAIIGLLAMCSVMNIVYILV